MRATRPIVANQWQNPREPRANCDNVRTVPLSRRSCQSAGHLLPTIVGWHGCHAEGRGLESLQPLARNARCRATKTGVQEHSSETARRGGFVVIVAIQWQKPPGLRPLAAR